MKGYKLLNNWLNTWWRRAVAVTCYLFAWVVIAILLPLLLLLTVGLDLIWRNRFATVRAVLMASVYFTCELIGIVMSLLIWLFSFVWAGGNRERFIRWNFNLQQWWTGALFASAQRIYQLRLEVTGDRIERGPVIVFMRHTSLADTRSVFSSAYGIAAVDSPGFQVVCCDRSKGLTQSLEQSAIVSRFGLTQVRFDL